MNEEWNESDSDLWELLNELDSAWMEFADAIWAVTGIQVSH